MKKLLSNNKTGALMAILILAAGSISIDGIIQFVMAQDGDTLKNLLGGCIYGACKNTTISGGSGGGQPTPNMATLIVRKEVSCPQSGTCPSASYFKITVTGNNVSPKTFDGSTLGTKVTLDAGDYKISETAAFAGFLPSFSGECIQDAVNSPSASGSINAGNSQTCTIKNLIGPTGPQGPPGPP